MTETQETEAARARIMRQRNTVMGWLLAGIVVLIFAVSIVKMG